MGVVEEDFDPRMGLVMIAHRFGRDREDHVEPRRAGADVDPLARSDDDFEPYTDMPGMGALPIATWPVR